MSNLFTNLLTHLTLFFYTQSKYLLLVIVFGLCAMGLVVGHAQVIAKCNVATPKITMTSVLNLGSFLPIIPFIIKFSEPTTFETVWELESTHFFDRKGKLCRIETQLQRNNLFAIPNHKTI